MKNKKRPKTDQNNRSNKMDVAQEHKRRKLQKENSQEFANEFYERVIVSRLKTDVPGREEELPLLREDIEANE